MALKAPPPPYVRLCIGVKGTDVAQAGPQTTGNCLFRGEKAGNRAASGSTGRTRSGFSGINTRDIQARGVSCSG